ncbi:hypothetical protein H0H93_016818 [Arthromyces matolae]|nr:hypothetical protein H0H93_016818 [Arthromyces matolae]
MSKQCVVSLATADIESRHIFRPWAFDEDSLAKLEYEWGFKYRTCNHDVATNRVYLTRELGHLFESGFWAFLPLEWDFFVDVLKISRASSSIPIETAYKGRKTFKYRFVPMPGILRSPIIRVEDSKPAHLQSHAFPFTSLPALELPILPHFAIMDLIHKFSKYKTLDIKPSAEYGPYLNPLFLPVPSVDNV